MAGREEEENILGTNVFAAREVEEKEILWDCIDQLPTCSSEMPGAPPHDGRELATHGRPLLPNRRVLPRIHGSCAVPA